VGGSITKRAGRARPIKSRSVGACQEGVNSVEAAKRYVFVVQRTGHGSCDGIAYGDDTLSRNSVRVIEGGVI
jgi:hypothetical protein